MHLGDAVFRIISHARLLDVVEALLGPEIVSNPVQHVRMKLPERARPDGAGADYLTGRVSWHQDLGVLMEEADAATILSCWIAVTDATVENGCLQVIPGSHRRDLIDHCPTGHDLGIPDRFLHLADATPLPMRAGSALIFGQQLVHGSLDNTTGDQVRISIDLRYQPPGQPSGRPDFPSFLVRGAGDPRIRRGPGRPRRVAAALGRRATPLVAAGDPEVQPLGRRLAIVRLTATPACGARAQTRVTALRACLDAAKCLPRRLGRATPAPTVKTENP